MELEKITKERRRLYDDACGTAHGLELIGERWALLVLRELMLGPRRFSQLRADLPGISANVLTQRLGELEARGLVMKKKLLKRTPSETDGRRYHLSLTDKGRKTFAPLEDSTRRDVAAMLDSMPPVQRHRMVQAMDAIEAAMGTGASIPLGELARNLYAMNSRAGNGKLDFSSVVKLVSDN